ncbi:MAG: hypothetical protein EOO73_34175 [Myxococcales bacterium]|nr:MAG: hypothetical protein EOO73_34175 [Myxococcales bacterium]
MSEGSIQSRAMRFAGQFVLRPPAGLARRERLDFSEAKLGSGFELLTHHSAPIHRGAGAAEVALVGTALSPAAPGATDREIAQRLATCATFDDLERATASLTGRWLLFASIGGQSRLYPDATCSRAIFYAGEGAQVTAASQPALLAEEANVPADATLLSKLWASPSADAWPAAFTPYPGARQLLPNHYLDLSTGRAVRFWPKRELQAVALDDAACGFADTLTGVFRALSRRGAAINLPITGGIDSRMLLACSREIRQQVRCFTVVDAATPLHDVLLPLRLFGKLGLDFRFVVARSSSQSDELLRLNTGSVWRDPHEHRISAFRAQGVHALGTVSEVCRCYYYSQGEHPTSVDGQLLARLAGWGDERLAIVAYEQWLAELPDSNVPILDLFYWECRLGNWAALDAMALDGHAQNLSPFNCRSLLELGLGVETRHRRAPHALQQRVCDLAAPELRGLPFNRTWLGSLSGRARGAIPGGLREGMKQVRRRMAGAPLRA